MKFALVLLASATTVFADAVHKHAKRADHAAINNRVRRNEAETLEKRQSYTGQATWYDVTTGTGACGQNMSPSDFVVALNSPQLDAYGGYVNGVPSTCFDSITITYNGMTQVATIKDECPTCGWGSLDMSEGLFSSFADLGVGVFPITWWFNTGGSDTGSAPSSDNNGGDQQTPTTQWQAPPTTTQPAWTPPPPTTTSSSSVYVPPPSPTTNSTTPPAPTPSSTTTTSQSGSTDQGTSSPSDNPGYDNVPMMNSAVVQLAQLINAAVPH